MRRGQAPRLLAAGVLSLALAGGALPTQAQNQAPAPQQKAQPTPKKLEAKPKPRPKAAPKKKPRPRPKPKPQAMPPAEHYPMVAKRLVLPAPAPAPKQLLTPAQAAARHHDGLMAEEAGDDRTALRAFTDAAHSGHGPAQLKLGELYDRGNAAIERDYATSLGWYQKARENGMPVAHPHVYPEGH